MNLFLLDPETSLLENMVAVNLLRKYGREDAVYFYNHGVEVDFYIPEEELAIQVCDALADTEAFDRKIKALLKLPSTVACKKLMVITRDEERILEIDGNTIEVIPVWKWLLS